MPKICKRYAEYAKNMLNMQNICKNYAKNMPKICRKYAKKYAKNMQNMHNCATSRICKKYANNMLNMHKLQHNMQAMPKIGKICTGDFADAAECYDPGPSESCARGVYPSRLPSCNPEPKMYYDSNTGPSCIREFLHPSPSCIRVNRHAHGDEP